MILIDLNQIIISSIAVSLKDQVIDEKFIRHIALNTIRSFKTKHEDDFGELVICCDTKHSWRKEFFPQYKANRKAARDSSPFDWKMIFSTLDMIRTELKTIFPYKIIEVEGAEADDIISTLVTDYKDKWNLIVSSDKDFLQLQKYDKTRQFSPILKKFIGTDNPKGYLKEHIIKGDRGDGIPNMLSTDNCLVEGARQTVLSSKRMDTYTNMTEFELLKLSGYCRNRKLIDLEFTPGEIKDKIREAFAVEPPIRNFKRLQTYFMDKDLRNLYGVIDEF